jgi:Transcription-silencing protein, cryptic loci regulator Clr2
VVSDFHDILVLAVVVNEQSSLGTGSSAPMADQSRVRLSPSTSHNSSTHNILRMSTTRDTSADSSQATSDDQPTWTKHSTNLYSVTLQDLPVRQSANEEEVHRDAQLLLVTRTDGINSGGSVPDQSRDTRLDDESKERQIFICRVGDLLAGKAGLSSVTNNPTNPLWHVLPEMLYGYEVFERKRLVSKKTRRSDLYVAGHPAGGLFRTAGEYAEHLWWLGEGDDEKQCACPLCLKERQDLYSLLLESGRDSSLEHWRVSCRRKARERTGLYLHAIELSSFWGTLPEFEEQDDDDDDDDGDEEDEVVEDTEDEET